MHVFQALKHLIDDVLLMNVFQDIRSNDSVQISVHKIEYQIDISVVFCSDHILKSNNVLVAGELL